MPVGMSAIVSGAPRLVGGAMDYQVYAYLQPAQDKEALAVLVTIQTFAPVRMRCSKQGPVARAPAVK